MRLSFHKIILLLLLSCCLQLQQGYAQSARDNRTVATQQAGAHPSPDAAQWQKLSQDKSFDYASEKELEDTPQKKPAQPGIWANVFGSLLSFFTSTAGSAILWLGLFLVLGYALFRIFIGEKSFIFRKSKKVLATDIGAPVAEDLLDVDWEQRLRKAYDESDLRLAIRYSYMWLLQLMQERELIQYRNDKTNHEYFHELAETQYKQPFRQLTREYEFAWYGHYPVSSSAYQQYMQLFNDIKTRLN